MVRAFVDLDAWKRDSLVASAALQWLRAAGTDEDEERLARQEVRDNLRRLRGWVEARLAADEKPGHG